MSQSAANRPDPTLQRKAAIVNGGVKDHAGRVRVSPMENFDLDRTIFQTLEGALPRFVMSKRMAREVRFEQDPAEKIQQAYETTRRNIELPLVDQELIDFLVEQCDFDVEHAEGSFLDHLYFGFEYSVQHYPEHSPIVMLLHSILGTGTNTFAMTADKIPQLKVLVTEFEWRHIEAFPSVLRLLYTEKLVETLHENAARADAIARIQMHRVIDNKQIALSGEDLWIQLNYQLMHLIDFLPVANWTAHLSDTSFILFRELYALLERVGKLDVAIDYEPPRGPWSLEGETADLATKLITRLPSKVVKKMSARSIEKFSARIGHSLEFRVDWA